jgi:hypothetical protein
MISMFLVGLVVLILWILIHLKQMQEQRRELPVDEAPCGKLRGAERPHCDISTLVYGAAHHSSRGRIVALLKPARAYQGLETTLEQPDLRASPLLMAAADGNSRTGNRT